MWTLAFWNCADETWKNNISWIIKKIDYILDIYKKLGGSQGYSKCSLSNIKLWLLLSCQNTGFIFHHKIRLYYIQYQTLRRIIHNLFGLRVSLILHIYLVWWMMFRPVQSWEWNSKLLQPDVIIHCLLEISYPEPYIIYSD